MTGAPVWLALTLVAALGCGLVAGVFFAFSTFVMRALSSRPPAEGIAAMQSINVVVINLWFLGAFLGVAALCAVLLVSALVRWPEPPSGYLALGSALYLAGTLGVTIACNVPRNNALAAVDPRDPASATAWTTYVEEWTRWNHVRTAAALAASASFAAALVR